MKLLAIDLRYFHILLFLAVHFLLFSQDTPPWLEDSPIVEGSQEEQELLQFLAEELQDSPWTLQFQDYRDNPLVHSFGQSLYLRRPGPGDSHLILALSLNSSHGRDNSKWQLLMELLEDLETRDSRATLSVLLLTGEEQPWPVGTINYLDQTLPDPDLTGLIYLDLGKDLSHLVFSAGSTGQLSSLWMVEGLLQSLEDQGLQVNIDSTELQVHRSAYSPETAYIARYLNQGIPAILLESQDPGQENWQGKSQLIEALGQFYEGFEQLDHHSTERNYFLLRWQGASYFIAEREILVIYLGFFSLILLMTLFQYRKILLNLRRYQGQLWMVALALFLMFLFLLLSTLLLEELGYLLRDSSIWLLVPQPALALKLGLSFIFASFFLFILRGMAIPRTPHFYSYSAFLFAFVNLVVFSLLEITLSSFWIWTLLFTLLFTLSRRQVPKILTLVLIPLPFVLALLTILQGHYPKLHTLFLQSRIWGNLFLALNLMPFILLLTSLHYSRYYYKKERQSLVGPLSILLALLTTLGLFYYFITESNRIAQANQLIRVMETIDLNQGKRTLILEADQPMGELGLRGLDTPIEMENLGRTLELELPPPQGWLEVQGETQLFLDRQNHRLTITPIGEPAECLIEISSHEPITLYDCNYPFEVNPQGTRIELKIGRYPPNPLPLEITLNRQAQAKLHCRFIYRDFPYSFELESSIPYQLETLTILQDFPL